MALQGTIESFALADVLRLLSQSSKTGRLIVNGDRGSANLWISAGELVGGGSAAQPHADDVVDVLFDMLRFESGSFIFESDATAPSPQPPTAVGPALEQAEAAIGEWHEIVRVVPSLDAWVSLAPELPHAEVVVDQACWTSIVTIGGGVRVAELAARLDLGELPVSRLVRALVTAGFVQVDAEPPTWRGDLDVVDHESVHDAPAHDGQTQDAVDLAPADRLPALPTRQPAHTDVVEDPFGDADGGVALPSLRISGLTDDPFADATDPESSPFEAYSDSGADELEGAELDEAGDPAPDPTADVARSMSMLSPKAAQALAAVAGSDGVDGTGDGGEDVGDEGRSKMLRFLGSV